MKKIVAGWKKKKTLKGKVKRFMLLLVRGEGFKGSIRGFARTQGDSTYYK